MTVVELGIVTMRSQWFFKHQFVGGSDWGCSGWAVRLHAGETLVN